MGRPLPLIGGFLLLSLASKTRLRVSPASSALKVIESLLPADFKIFVRDAKFMPSGMLRSQRKFSKPSALSISVARATCVVSMACNEIPDELQSKLASFTSSFKASTIFLKIEPSDSFASSIATSFFSLVVNEKKKVNMTTAGQTFRGGRGNLLKFPAKKEKKSKLNSP